MKSDYKKSITTTIWKKRGSTYQIRKIKGSRYYEACDDRSNVRIYKKFLAFKNADAYIQKTIKDDTARANRRTEKFRKQMEFYNRG